MDTSDAHSANDIYTTPTHSADSKGQRQQSPPRATPATDNETPSTAGDLGDQDPQSLAEHLDYMKFKDDYRVSKILAQHGGGVSQKRPADDLMKPGKSQDLHMVKMKFELDDFDTEVPLPDRPDNSKLRRLTAEELRPPTSNVPIPLDLLDTGLPEFAIDQRIEFLVIMRPESSDDDDWQFPTEKVLQTMYDAVREQITDIQLFDVALWHRVDGNGIATIMLSTINLKLMAEIRHKIRLYRRITGHIFEMYNKRTFMKRFGISAKENSGISFPQIVGSLNEAETIST